MHFSSGQHARHQTCPWGTEQRAAGCAPACTHTRGEENGVGCVMQHAGTSEAGCRSVLLSCPDISGCEAGHLEAEACVGSGVQHLLCVGGSARSELACLLRTPEGSAERCRAVPGSAGSYPLAGCLPTHWTGLQVLDAVQRALLNAFLSQSQS